MSKSLFSVVVQVPGQSQVSSNVLAEDANSKTALQNAIDAAITQAGSGAQFVNAVEVGGKPVDVTVAAAVSPVTDLMPKSLYSIQFRAGSGANGANVSPLLVLANTQNQGGTIVAAQDLAITAALNAVTSGTPNAAIFMGSVDQDATE
ncbi:MAG TPA: hypothetical protein VN736_01240 [Candidatus Limnocylindrales bacterium]|nr:hypothetical protein [Candidatus Limnocylindrales bacterium]